MAPMGEVRNKKSIPFIILALAAVSCARGDCLLLQESDNGKTNSIISGTEIEIKLKGNPTTGYSWETVSFTTNSLQQIGAGQYRQTEQSAGRPRVGVGGQFVFRFKAIVSGQGQIRLIYRRPWETTACDKVYSVVFDVK